jgi:hypothetical protein
MNRQSWPGELVRPALTFQFSISLSTRIWCVPARDDQTESDAAGLQLSYKQLLQPQGTAGSHVMSVTKSSVVTTRMTRATRRPARHAGGATRRPSEPHHEQIEQVNRARALQ